VHTEALKQNVALNWLDDDVTVEQVALGEGSGWVRVVDDERGGTLEPIGLENYAVPSDINIPIRSLDDYSEHAPALVKVDVNGMETQVLIGAEQMIKTHQPVVYVDITQHGQEVAVGRVLEPWGYVLQRTFVDRQSVVGEWEPQ
jgi:FkbM family methyltransferase